MTEGLTWRKSTHSGEGQSDCVEVAHSDRLTLVRDSKNPSGPRIAFPSATWQAFLTGRV